MRTPILYLLAIAAAEAITTTVNPIAGVISHALLLLTLVAHASFDSQHPVRKLYLALSLAPLIRILSLSMPLGAIPVLYWYAIIAVPLLTATFLSIRLLGYSRGEVGLTLGNLPLQLLIGLVGLPLGVVEYLILAPKPLADSFSLGAVWLPVVILVVGTGFTEELVFRGVLQKAALERMGTRGLFYVAVLFALLHMGYYSVAELAFVFVVGLFLAWVVVRSGSILGTSLAHGLLNSVLFLFAPLWGAFLLPLEPLRMPDLTFFGPPLASVATSTPSPQVQQEVSVEARTTPSPQAATPMPTPSPTSIPIAATATPPFTYTVQPGDTLYFIAERFGTSIEALVALNNLRDRNLILAWQQLLVPQAANP